MLKFSEIFEFSRENSYFERIRIVRMVRMVRSLADRTFQLCLGPEDEAAQDQRRDAAAGRRDGRVHGHEASDARVPEAGHVERAPAVEAVPPAHWGWPTARHTKFCQKCCKNSIKFGPFSAVSAPIFASKYSFCSSLHIFFLDL